MALEATNLSDLDVESTRLVSIISGPCDRRRNSVSRKARLLGL